MDELEISGKRFISSRRAGKEHGYHSDYIGQLIRSGKVRGQKVGRAWYVELSSLQNYLGPNEPKQEVVSVPDPEPEPPQPQPAPAVVEEPQIVAVRKPEIIKIVKEEPVEKVVTETPVHIHIRGTHSTKPSGLTYLRDDEPVLPEVEEQPPQEEAAATFVVERRRTKNIPAAALLVVGFAAFIAGLGASYFVYATVEVEQGQTTGVGYSLGKDSR